MGRKSAIQSLNPQIWFNKIWIIIAAKIYIISMDWYNAILNKKYHFNCDDCAKNIMMKITIMEAHKSHLISLLSDLYAAR